MHVAIATSDRTRRGYITAHSSACIPPIDPPITDSQRVTPRCSASRDWARTMSRIVTTGNRDPYGAPSSGCGDGGAGRTLAAAEHVGAHDEVLVGVDRLAGPDRVVPPTRRGVATSGRPGGVAVAGPGVAHQHGVRGVGVEASPRLVGDHDVAQHHAAVEREAAIGGEREELAVTRIVARQPGAGWRRGSVFGHDRRERNGSTRTIRGRVGRSACAGRSPPRTA